MTKEETEELKALLKAGITDITVLEYVTGTMDDGARSAFEERMRSSKLLQDLVQRTEKDLNEAQGKSWLDEDWLKRLIAKEDADLVYTNIVIYASELPKGALHRELEDLCQQDRFNAEQQEQLKELRASIASSLAVDEARGELTRFAQERLGREFGLEARIGSEVANEKLARVCKALAKKFEKLGSDAMKSLEDLHRWSMVTLAPVTIRGHQPVMGLAHGGDGEQGERELSNLLDNIAQRLEKSATD